MTLRPPVLDDRRFNELVRDAQDRIIRRFPEWTDLGPSDPGMALVDLFAWYTETLLHQMAQLPSLHYFAFLDLLGMAPRPPLPARAAIRFTAEGAAAAGDAPPVILPGTPSLTLSAPDGSRVGFQTERRLGLVTRPLVRLERRLPASSDGADDDGGERGADGGDLLAVAVPGGAGFWPFGPLGRVGSRFFLGFEARENDEPARVFPETVSLFVRPVGGGERRPAAAALGPVPPCVHAEPTIEAFAVVDERTREPLEILPDSDARLFDREGYVHVRGPRQARPRRSPDASSAASNAPLCYWLGFEVEGPSFPFEEAVCLHLVVNAVEAVARETVRLRDVGESNGLPDQSFTLRDPPLDQGSLDLVVVPEPTAGGDLRPLAERAEPWGVVADFAASGPHDEHVVVDGASGRLRFGDGLAGMIPPAGYRIVARSYRRGGGAATNVAAEAIRFEPRPGVAGTNPFAAEGGSDAEPAEALAARAPGRLRHLDRIVTPDDAERIACDRHLGGMARARAERGRHPDYPATVLTGALTIWIAPPIVPRRRHPPYPTRAQFEQVVQVLEARRLIGQELFVRPAEVRPVYVSARVEAEPGIAGRDVENAAITALDGFINAPARGFGQWLHPLQLSAELQSVPQIRRVIALSYRLGENGEPVDTGRLPPRDDGDDEAADGVRRIPRIDDHEIFWSAFDHTIRIEEAPS